MLNLLNLCLCRLEDPSFEGVVELTFNDTVRRKGRDLSSLKSSCREKSDCSLGYGITSASFYQKNTKSKFEKEKHQNWQYLLVLLNCIIRPIASICYSPSNSENLQLVIDEQGKSFENFYPSRQV